MLEHVPAWLGRLLHDRRAGHEKLVAADPDIRLSADTIDLYSPAFAHGTRLPVCFTADGDGVSPPLIWAQVPDQTASLALIVEDPDAPSSRPLVHAIVWDMPPDQRRVVEGAIVPDGRGSEDGDVGHNSFCGRVGFRPTHRPVMASTITCSNCSPCRNDQCSTRARVAARSLRPSRAGCSQPAYSSAPIHAASPRSSARPRRRGSATGPLRRADRHIITPNGRASRRAR